MAGEDPKEEKHKDEEKSKDKEKKEKEGGEKKEKKKKEKAPKNPDEKKKIKDPAALKAKLQKIDEKMEALRVKKEEMTKQLHELEAAAAQAPAEEGS